jgi:hypothetical protein
MDRPGKAHESKRTGGKLAPRAGSVWGGFDRKNQGESLKRLDNSPAFPHNSTDTPLNKSRGFFLQPGGSPLASHNEEVEAICPEAFTGIAPCRFPCAPRYRPWCWLTRETSDREVGMTPLFPEILRPSLLVVLWFETLMLFPKGAMNLRTRKHDSVVKGLRRV